MIRGEALNTLCMAVREAGASGATAVSRSTLSILQPRWTDSRFLSSVWIAKRTYPGESSPIKVFFENISPQWRVFARLLLVLAEYPLGHRKVQRRIRSAWRSRNVLYELKWLTSFLEREGLSAFCEMSPEAGERALRLWASTPVRTPNEARGMTSYVQMLSTMERLYHLGPSELALLPDGLSFDPTTLPGPGALGFHVGPTRSTPEIEEGVGRRLWQAAFHWLQVVGPALVIAVPSATELSELPGRATSTRGFRSLREELLSDVRHTAALDGLVRALPFDHSILLRPRPYSDQQELQAEVLLRRRSVELIGAAWDLTTAAAYIVMGMLSGFRIGELLSISAGGLRQSANGWRVTSTIWKPSSREEGYLTDRPVPSGFAEAHQLLQRLLSAAGQPSPDTPIFQNVRGIVPPRDRVNDLINRFASLHGIDWHFTSHQFRKFFAIFYVRRFQGPLDALRWHFRHLTREMIEAYVKDALNARYLAEAKAAETEEIFASIIHGDGNYSFPPPVSRYEGLQARYRAMNLPLEDVEGALRSAVATAGAKVFAMEWGYCIDTLGTTGAEACATGVVEADRGLATPGECYGCPHFLVGRENEARIRQSLALHRDILCHPDSAHLAKKFSGALIRRLDEVLVTLGTGLVAARTQA